jgi:hypothetical protein
MARGVVTLSQQLRMAVRRAFAGDGMGIGGVGLGEREKGTKGLCRGRKSGSRRRTPLSSVLLLLRNEGGKNNEIGPTTLQAYQDNSFSNLQF